MVWVVKNDSLASDFMRSHDVFHVIYDVIHRRLFRYFRWHLFISQQSDTYPSAYFWQLEDSGEIRLSVVIK